MSAPRQDQTDGKVEGDKDTINITISMIFAGPLLPIPRHSTLTLYPFCTAFVEEYQLLGTIIMEINGEHDNNRRPSRAGKH